MSISIVIPSYNRPRLAERAVKSAIAACPADGEIILVDNGSIIPLSQHFESWQCDKLRIIEAKETNGAAYARNIGVLHARNDIIFFLDDDDELLKDYCISVSEKVIEKNIADFGFSNIEVIDSESGKKASQIRNQKSGEIQIGSKIRNSIAGFGMGFWIKKNLFLELGGIDQSQQVDEDTDFCVRLFAAGAKGWFEEIPGVRVYKNHYPNKKNILQLSVRTPKEVGCLCYLRTYRNNRDFFPTTSWSRWYLLSRFIRRAVKANQIDIAVKEIQNETSMTLSIAANMFLKVKLLTSSKEF